LLTFEQSFLNLDQLAPSIVVVRWPHNVNDQDRWLTCRRINGRSKASRYVMTKDLVNKGYMLIIKKTATTSPHEPRQGFIVN